MQLAFHNPKTVGLRKLLLIAGFVGLGPLVPLASAQTLTTLVSFGSVSGSGPAGTSPLSLLLSGNVLYGTTAVAGGYDAGEIFSVPSSGGTPTVLASFAAPSNSNSAGLSGNLALFNGTLFGTTEWGGSSNLGTLFSVPTSGGGAQVLTSFNNNIGTNPYGGLLLAGTTLYGTAGGGPSGNGVVFSESISGGSPSVVTAFNGTDGSVPGGNLILSGTTLYGVTSNGPGASSDGEVFSVQSSGGTPTVLATFNGTNGEHPTSVVLSGGVLYGTTGYGGQYGKGEVFSVPVTGGTPTVLASFNGTNGVTPSSNLIISNGMLYGTTLFGTSTANSGGEVFSVPITGGAPTVLVPFNENSESFPTGLVISANNLYGVTESGGANGGGTVFEVALPVTAASWAQATSGNWSSASDWSPATIPTSTIDADFATGSATAYAVTLTGPSSCNNMNVSGDNVTIQTNGNTLAVAGSLALSPGSTLVIENSTLSPSVVNRAIADGVHANDISPGGGVTVAGTVNVGGTTFTSAESVQIGSGETLTAPNVVVQPLGLLSGSGTVIGSLSNYGTIQPGSYESGGKLALVGNYAQSASEPVLNTPAVLAIAINGASSSGNFNALSVMGSAALAGNLSVTLGTTDGSTYLPSSADTYQILTATGAVTGQFSNGKTFVSAYSGSSGNLAGVFTTHYSNSTVDTSVSNGVVLSDFRVTSPLDYFGVGINWNNVPISSLNSVRGDLDAVNLMTHLQAALPNFNSSAAVLVNGNSGVDANQSGAPNFALVQSAFSTFSENVSANSTVLFYVSTHGFVNGSLWLSSDATNSITDASIASDLNSLPTTTRKVVILDACHSGIIASELINEVPNVLVLAASTAAGTTPCAADGTGVFTDALEAALDKGDTDFVQIAQDISAGGSYASLQGQNLDLKDSGSGVFSGIQPDEAQSSDFSGDLLSEEEAAPTPEPSTAIVLVGGCFWLALRRLPRPLNRGKARVAV